MGVATYKGVPIVWRDQFGRNRDDIFLVAPWVGYEMAHGKSVWDCVQMTGSGKRPDPELVDDWMKKQCQT